MEDAQRCTGFHVPVLVDAVLAFLLTNPSGIYVDGTVGGGGHGESILNRLDKKGKLIGIDRDERAISFCRERFSSYGDRIRLVQGEFGDVDVLLGDLGISEVDGLLLDLGVSSHQIDTVERGFSYLTDGPLDMRMDMSVLKRGRDVINGYSEADLFSVLVDYGEERFARRIARRIVESRRKKSIETTRDLADVVRRVVPQRTHVKTLSRVFQAVRMEVNDELGQLRTGLEGVYPLLKSGGRIVVISYESLMDRMVKRFFRGEAATFSKHEAVQSDSRFCFRVLTRRIVRPSVEEVAENPRARSARLRAAEKV